MTVGAGFGVCKQEPAGKPSMAESRREAVNANPPRTNKHELEEPRHVIVKKEGTHFVSLLRACSLVSKLVFFSLAS